MGGPRLILIVYLTLIVAGTTASILIGLLQR